MSQKTKAARGTCLLFILALWPLASDARETRGRIARERGAVHARASRAYLLQRQRATTTLTNFL